MTASVPRWEGNTLMVRWYGSIHEDETAYWRDTTKDHCGLLLFDGYDATMRKRLYHKPPAQEAFDIIIRWQNNY